MNEDALQDAHQCSKCGKLVEGAKVCFIDDTAFCPKCMYGDVEPFEIYPIGIVRSNLSRNLNKEFGLVGDPKEESRIELVPTQKAFMYKLEEEEYITVVYYLHKTKSPRSIFRRKIDLKEVGVFASRSPDRLSKIAVTDVRLIKIEDTTLYVEGLDAIDGSPVLDIKLQWKKGR
ncbi:MAG: SAM-dependent methyltransferase [Deltaproteobacteria bacterium]|nr:SAM-dependent methyltransferase [Deltaproteobacteria bacterium]